MASSSPSRLKLIRLLDRVCRLAALLCVPFLVHGRGGAEAMIDIVAAGFVLRSGLAGDWRWLRTPWVPVAALWWGWLVVCSLPFGPFGIGGMPSFWQAVATIRFLLFVAALQHRVLNDLATRRWMRWLIVAACLYIAGQMLLQFVTGRNLFGDPRFGDGTLTGPYDKPRAAAPLSRLLLPVMLVASAWLLARISGRIPGRTLANRLLAGLAALLPLLAGVAIIVLGGQRMPMLLTLLGLLVSGLLLPRLRPALVLALLAAPVLVAVSAFVSPGSFHHLVILFSAQMHHFGRSPYGLIYNRAVSIAFANPLTGLGFDGFRHGCPDPANFRDWLPWGPASGDGGGAEICVQHAHNHALQALTDAGIAGLLLFWAMVAFWLANLARGLLRRQVIGQPALLHAWRVGLFAAIFIHEWPIASASAFTNMPLGGWFFLLLGVGLAEAAADPHMQPNRDSEGRDV